ncbi:hypothetical protein GOBAR_AA31523 [Gossypium barbadense]|uniref:Uncharacterized protein n=1 Tax=Gossypium barbadense TaxID=3634 RepID=A0A2P5WDK1_GOSBA|nr:hypothetical protein GOBAR_AA31523 [Gossypium barbadense]
MFTIVSASGERAPNAPSSCQAHPARIMSLESRIAAPKVAACFLAHHSTSTLILKCSPFKASYLSVLDPLSSNDTHKRLCTLKPLWRVQA